MKFTNQAIITALKQGKPIARKSWPAGYHARMTDNQIDVYYHGEKTKDGLWLCGTNTDDLEVVV